MKRILLVLGLATCGACGGAQFDVGLNAHDAEADADDAAADAADAADTDAADAQSVPDSSHPGDSGGAESSGDATGDAPEDTRMADDANGGDTGQDARAEAGCVLGSTFDCEGIPIVPPTTYCVNVTGGAAIGAETTPTSCDSCSTYTCDCIVQQSGSLMGGCDARGIKSCTDDNGQVTITCN